MFGPWGSPTGPGAVRKRLRTKDRPYRKLSRHPGAHAAKKMRRRGRGKFPRSRKVDQARCPQTPRIQTREIQRARHLPHHVQFWARATQGAAPLLDAPCASPSVCHTNLVPPRGPADRAPPPCNVDGLGREESIWRSSRDRGSLMRHRGERSGHRECPGQRRVPGKERCAPESLRSA